MCIMANKTLVCRILEYSQSGIHTPLEQLQRLSLFREEQHDTRSIDITGQVV